MAFDKQNCKLETGVRVRVFLERKKDKERASHITDLSF
jgi:hypothetical protein